jgi:nitrogen regulatory protein PII
MKAVFIVFNQANTERVEFMLDKLAIRGFTFFEQVQGRGTVDGEPHRGTHTWPEMNSAMMTMVEDDRVDELMKSVHKLDIRNKEYGVRAFVWNIEKSV